MSRVKTGIFITTLITSSYCYASNFNLPPNFEQIDINTPLDTQETIQPPANTVISPSAQTTTPMDLQLTVTGLRDTYYVGENLKFALRSNQDCYLTLINEGISGNTTVLFPNKDRQNTLIQANTTYDIPGHDLLPIQALAVSKPKHAVRTTEKLTVICRLEDTAVFNSPYQFENYAYRRFSPDKNWRNERQAVASHRETQEVLQFAIKD